MISQADDLWANARECCALVEEVCDPELKRLYCGFARLWRALAEHIEAMEQNDPQRGVVVKWRARMESDS